MTIRKPSHQECLSFYEERDRRTAEYVGQQIHTGNAIHVGIDGDAARSQTGQVLLLSLANQLARVHRHVVFTLPAARVPLLVRRPFSSEGALADTLIQTCYAIDPCGTFVLGSAAPAGVSTSIGIGMRVGEGYDWYAGALDSIAYLDRQPCRLGISDGTLRGAALASCLGAAAVFRSALGLEAAPRVLSAWNLREEAAADSGPASLEPLDVGRVLMVGAGAVGAALAYWLHTFGVAGYWVVLDKDEVELHNTNRGLLFTAADAGWPGAVPGGSIASKAELAACFLAGVPVVKWYDEAEETAEAFDVVLCLANERDVRTRVAQRNAPVVLHATTGTSWLSELHRHVLGTDDCIRCRMRDVRAGQFSCSVAPIPSGPPGSDAALPFLSAASGLMLATALQRLQASALTEDPWNDWRWDFGSTNRMVSGGVRPCGDDCATLLPFPVRSRKNSGSRWAHLDGSPAA